jgi:hypothetical protein
MSKLDKKIKMLVRLKHDMEKLLEEHSELGEEVDEILKDLPPEERAEAKKILASKKR